MLWFFKNKKNPQFDFEGFDPLFENNIVWDVNDGMIPEYTEPKPKKHQKSTPIDVKFNKEVEQEQRNKLAETITDSKQQADWDVKQQVQKEVEWQKNKPAFDIISSAATDFVNQEEAEDIELNELILAQKESSIEYFVELEKKEQAELSKKEALRKEEIEEKERQEALDSQHDFLQHNIDLQVDKDGTEINFKPKSLSLASSVMIEDLQKKHILFYNLLARIQETHAPNDFVAAYHIQDRISYLLTNPSLLYKTLVKQLIPYLEKINQKLQTYYSEISAKQEDLKSINQQIHRFTEYSRNTTSNIDDLKEEQMFLKEDADKLQEKQVPH